MKPIKPVDNPILILKCNYLGQFKLKSNAQITPDEANKHLDIVLNRQNFHPHLIKMRIFSNGIQTTRASVLTAPCENFFPFTSLQRLFVFRAEPTILLLGLLEKWVKSFIVFQFASESALNMACDEIERAKSNQVSSTPNLLVLNSKPVPIEKDDAIESTGESSFRPIKESEKLLPETTGEKPILFHDTSIGINSSDFLDSSQSNQNLTFNENEKNVPQNDVQTYMTVQPVYGVPPKLERQQNYELVDAKRWKSVPMKTIVVPSNEEWEISEMYLAYDPKSGPKICDNGPIYMYSAQMKSSATQSVISCQSSPLNSQRNSYDLDRMNSQTQQIKF